MTCIRNQEESNNLLVFTELDKFICHMRAVYSQETKTNERSLPALPPAAIRRAWASRCENNSSSRQTTSTSITAPLAHFHGQCKGSFDTTTDGLREIQMPSCGMRCPTSSTGHERCWRPSCASWYLMPRRVLIWSFKNLLYALGEKIVYLLTAYRVCKKTINYLIEAV